MRAFTLGFEAGKRFQDDHEIFELIEKGQKEETPSPEEKPRLDAGWTFCLRWSPFAPSPKALPAEMWRLPSILVKTAVGERPGRPDCSHGRPAQGHGCHLSSV